MRTHSYNDRSHKKTQSCLSYDKHIKRNTSAQCIALGFAVEQVT